jgi:hypothetical protein
MSALMKTGLVAAAGLLMAGAVTAVATAPKPAQAADKAGGQSCFNVHNLNGFSAPNDRTLYIRVGVHDVYRLDLMTDCTGLTFRQGIGLETVPPGDSFICSAIQTEITFHDNGMHERCPVNAMHKLTDDELTALPKKDRP